MTLEEAVRIYTVCAQAENKSRRTIEWVEGAVRRLEAFAGNQNLTVEDITTDFIRKFMLHLDKAPAFQTHSQNRTLARPISPETKATYVRALKSLFSQLTQEGYITDNPLVKIKTPKVPEKEPDVLTEAEVSRFFAVIDKKTQKGFRDHTVFLTLLDTGMRISELCDMTLDDADLENGYLKVMGKGKKQRFVPVGFKLTKALLKYMSSYRYRETGSDFVFITSEGHPLNRNRVAKLMRGYINQAGITRKWIHPHSLRATKSVLYLRNGGDPFSLQKMLGHKSLTMTRRYSAIADNDVLAAHRKHGVVDKLRI